MGGQSVAFEFRTQDARLGRFLSTDPLTAMTPWETPYAFAGNGPIVNIDYLGLIKKAKKFGKNKGWKKGKKRGLKDRKGRRKKGKAGRKKGSSARTVIRAKRTQNNGVKPLTTTRLREVARKRGIEGTGITFNRRVGAAFEHIAIVSQDNSVMKPIIEQQTFFSPERARRTAHLKRGPVPRVRPDGVRSVIVNEFQFWWPPINTTIYPNSSFFEVKAVRGILRLSSNRHQIRGILDVARRSQAGRVDKATVVFVTTADAIIGKDIKDRANLLGISLYQVVAGEKDGFIYFSNPLRINDAPFGRVDITSIRFSNGVGWQLPNGRLRTDPNDPDPTIVEDVQP